MRKTLDQLAERQLEINQLRAEITILALRARTEGATWVDIARVLGTTKQAAQRRFSKYLIDRDDFPGSGP